VVLDVADMRFRRGDEVAQILLAGVVVCGVQFRVFGWSNSGLKEGKVYLVARRTHAEIDALLASLGVFDMKSVGKRAKRIALLFTDAEILATLPFAHVREIPDKVASRTKELLTDGCGL
jgi:regulator of nonsense transcripts 1